MGKTREETFNLGLGGALRRTTARWKAEPRLIGIEETRVISGHKGLRPDVLLLDRLSPPVVIECSFSARDAERDAQARLGFIVSDGHQMIRTAIALHIPEAFADMSLADIESTLADGEHVYYAAYQAVQKPFEPIETRRFPRKGFVAGSVYDLAALLPAAALHKEEIERVADEVARLLSEAARGLERNLPEHMHRDIMSGAHQLSPLAAFRTMMVMWLNALLLQSFLGRQGVAGIKSAYESGGMLPVPSRQLRTWRTILGHNWEAIFAPAVKALSDASTLHVRATAVSLNLLYKARERIELARLGLHINVGAELFPKLSEDRKEAAAFYTQPSTAELLACLTIRYEDIAPEDWAKSDLFGSRVLADLACGTGTLLRAGYRRIASFHERAGGTEESLRDFHRAAMESGIRGADISPIAAHLTSSSLAALGSGEGYGKSQIGWVDVGGQDRRTGSLEYLDADNLQSIFSAAGGVSSGGPDTSKNGSSVVHVPDHSMDWILMNPPYSRTRGGQTAFDFSGLSQEVRKGCQKRWGHLIKSEPCIKTAGMAASFLALARRKVKSGGRIGFVLPLTAAFADAWTRTRRMIETDFKDIIAIAVSAGRALGRDALSADTNMEEMLLICTRKLSGPVENHVSGAVIRCVTLHYPPTRVGEAREIGRAVIGATAIAYKGSIPVIIGDDEIGMLYPFETAGDGAPWSPVGTLYPDLIHAAIMLSRGRLEFNSVSDMLTVDMSTIADVFDVGPTHDLIGHPHGSTSPRGAFKLHPVTGPTDAIGPDRALWTADARMQKTLVVRPTHKGSAPEGVGSDAKRESMRFWQSRLFYSRNMRWTSQALVAARTERQVMGGSSWTSLRHPDERVQKAFALWANSTLGMLVHWTRGQRTQAGRSRTQVQAVKDMPCPRLDTLSDDILDGVSEAFDAHKALVLMPACQAHADSVRARIDDIVLEMLRLGENTAQAVESLKWLWCNEPSVHGNNKKALRMLEP